MLLKMPEFDLEAQVLNLSSHVAATGGIWAGSTSILGVLAPVTTARQWTNPGLL